MMANGALISIQDWKSRGSDGPEMLKPPWWTVSLLLQRMVDELAESRTLSESVKVRMRTGTRLNSLRYRHYLPFWTCSHFRRKPPSFPR